MAALRNRGIRYQAGRELLPLRLAHQVLIRMEASGDITNDRVQNAVARSKAVKNACAHLWPPVRAERIAHQLLTDPAVLAVHAEGLLSVDEQAQLQAGAHTPSPGSMKWTAADLVLIDEIADQLNRTPSLGHVIIDEAQDLSPMQLRAIGRRASTGSVTLLGDLAQGTTPWATSDWATALDHLDQRGAEMRELVEGFRVPGDVIDFAARLLPVISPGLTPPRSVRHSRGELELIAAADLIKELPHQVAQCLTRPGTVGVITPDAMATTVRDALTAAGMEVRDLADPTRSEHRLDVVAASMAKGLEFDHVVVVEPETIADDPAGLTGDADHDRMLGLRRVYVALTRAVSSLVVVHARPLPAELAG